MRPIFDITTNNTIYGTRYPALPETGDVPLVADMSSNILSEVYDIRRFGVAYAGAQKNIGPAGLTVVIVRKDLLGRAMEITPKALNWQKQAERGSMLNTPPTYAIDGPPVPGMAEGSGGRIRDGKDQY